MVASHFLSLLLQQIIPLVILTVFYYLILQLLLDVQQLYRRLRHARVECIFLETYVVLIEMQVNDLFLAG